MKNKRIIIFAAVIIILTSGLVLLRVLNSKKQAAPMQMQEQSESILNEAKKEYLGIRSQPVEYRHMVKIIRLPGKVSHDYELYTLQQEYLSILANLNSLRDSISKEVYTRQEALLEAVRLRLGLLGISDTQISDSEKRNSPDKSLIYPASGKVWVHANIYEQDLSLVKRGQKVTAQMKGYPNEFKGTIYAIEDVLNAQTRSAKARIEIVDPDNQLKHEVYANLIVEIDLGRRLSIPIEGVIDTGTRKVAYVDTGAGRYRLALVKTGVEAQGYIELLEGLDEGEHVVIDGNFFLDSQTILTGGVSLQNPDHEQMKGSPKEPTHRH